VIEKGRGYTPSFLNIHTILFLVLNKLHKLCVYMRERERERERERGEENVPWTSERVETLGIQQTLSQKFQLFGCKLLIES
jgi:hypothetical protein